MAPRLNPKLATVRIRARTDSGETLENLKAAVVNFNHRRGVFQTKPLNLKPRTNFFFLQMPEGRYMLILSAPDFYEITKRIEFEKRVNPLIEITLKPIHTPRFRKFLDLSQRVQQIFERSGETARKTGEELYRSLGHVKKAAALNILAKMTRTFPARGARPSIVEAVDHIYVFRQDRIYVQMKKGANLLRKIRSGRKKKESPFVVAVPHKKFSEGSFKTKERNQKGNLQLSFNKRNQVDADIDIYTNYFLHFFGEVVWNHLMDVKTSPFRVYRILRKDKIFPEYGLRRNT